MVWENGVTLDELLDQNSSLKSLKRQSEILSELDVSCEQSFSFRPLSGQR
jgi:hypothetical protein